jgi:hypothetical protein
MVHSLTYLARDYAEVNCNWPEATQYRVIILSDKYRWAFPAAAQM